MHGKTKMPGDNPMEDEAANRKRPTPKDTTGGEKLEIRRENERKKAEVTHYYAEDLGELGQERERREQRIKDMQEDMKSEVPKIPTATSTRKPIGQHS